MFTILAILIFIRPFISSLAFPFLDLIYSLTLFACLLSWPIFNSIPFKEMRLIKYPIFIFILSLFISLIFSSIKINAQKELYNYITVILIFLISISLTEKNKKNIIYTIVFSGFLIGILAIYQYCFGFQHILNFITKEKITNPFALDYLSQKRAFLPFVTPNTLAGYLILVLPLVFNIKGAKKWVFFTPIVIALLFTKSVGAFLSLFLGIGLCFFLRKKWSKKTILLLAVVAICFVFIFILRSATIKQHFQPAFSITQRLNYWEDTLRIIKMHPFIGVGPGNFNLQASRYTHNSYLQLWAETGILGLFAFLWLIFMVIKRPCKNDSAWLLTVSIVVFLLHNMIDFTFFLPEVSMVWWVILGLGASEQFARQTD